jgi:chemotaxis protein histidine kinase CheA
MITDDLAAKMQEIIRKHADGYRKDLPALIDQMRAHIELLKSGGSIDCLPVLQREAHDMKGQGATFGLGGISSVAESLSRILEQNPAVTPALIAVLQAHVDALKSLLEKDDPAVVAATIALAK